VGRCENKQFFWLRLNETKKGEMSTGMGRTGGSGGTRHGLAGGWGLSRGDGDASPTSPELPEAHMVVTARVTVSLPYYGFPSHFLCTLLGLRTRERMRESQTDRKEAGLCCSTSSRHLLSPQAQKRMELESQKLQREIVNLMIQLS